MKNDIRLFINDEEIEFSADPKILLNYKETELHNPTIVRNTFTKQITVEGTNRNNDIFGHIWDLTRVQDESNFNPIIKTDFQLFVNDQLFTRGYCKLDKVTRTNNTTQYTLTLYGNLGTFFYNLSYLENSNVKKTLADLIFHDSLAPEPDLSFDITKEAVNEAWGQLAGGGSSYDEKWNIINFIPAYNGIPGDFDASKILVNNYHINQNTGDSGFRNGATIEGNTYRPVLGGALNQYGYSLAEMPDELTEWETRDLRSYLQRPCVSMKAIIDSCCQPDNNGGFQVKLDDHFFHINNPYFRDAWVTLPMLTDLEGVEGGTVTEITGATIPTASTMQYGANMYPIQVEGESLAAINNVNLDLSVRFSPAQTTTANTLYTHRRYKSNTTITLQPGTIVKSFEYNTGVIVQMFAYSMGGEVVGQSKAYFLGKSDTKPSNGEKMWDNFYDGKNDVGVEPDFVYLQGVWKKVDGDFVFADTNGNPVNINFTFQAPSNFVSMSLKVMTPFAYYSKYVWGNKAYRYIPNEQGNLNLYTSEYLDTRGNKTAAEVFALDRVTGRFYFVAEKMEGISVDYESLFSGTRITKKKLLTTEASPADYLLSYCKLFGLYFYYDSSEESDDPEIYPNGVVHIMDRDTFYTDEIVDLSELIDWDKKIEITPAMAASKWYQFDVEHADSEAENVYKGEYGRSYGSQTIDTNYNFDNNTINLYDGNVYKAGVMVLEKDKYFKKTPTGLPVYQYNGLKYSLFYRGAGDTDFTTTDFDFPISTTKYLEQINPLYEYYDSFPKLQLHTEDNSASDGSNVLTFFKGGISVTTDYWLTDDVADMATLNDATPCWIMTRDEYNAAGERIAYRTTWLPYFTRDLILFGSEYGNIVHSWNFGHPQVTYSPDTYTTDGDSLYDKCWRNYIRDLYDVNTRKLSCYVRAELDERPWPYWLRRFYWFENSIWMLNEIKDLNPASFDTTKMEFIKVQDMEDYKLEKIEYQGHNELILDEHQIGCSGGTITGRMILQGAGGWFATDFITGVDGHGQHYQLDSYQAMVPHSGRGQTETIFQVTVPGNSGDTPITWTVAVEDDFDIWYRDSFIQDTCAVPPTPSGDTSGDTIYIILTPSAQSVSQLATAATIAYQISGGTLTNFGITCNEGWAAATIGSGNVINIQMMQNSTPYDRTAYITASGMSSSGAVTSTATVRQRADNIDVWPDSITFGYQGNEQSRTEVVGSSEWTTDIIDN